MRPERQPISIESIREKQITAARQAKRALTANRDRFSFTEQSRLDVSDVTTDLRVRLGVPQESVAAANS